MANRFEEEARARKVERIIEAIDRISAGVDSARVYSWAKASDDERWALISMAADVKLPSAVTRKAVLSLLERRVRIEQIHRSA